LWALFVAGQRSKPLQVRYFLMFLLVFLLSFWCCCVCVLSEGSLEVLHFLA
jgi:hypothetical protein